MALRPRLSLVLLAVSLAGCAGDQSSLDPAAREAQAIAEHTWFVMGVSTAVYVVVMALLAFVLVRRRRRSPREGDDRIATILVTLGAVITTVIVLWFLVDAIGTGRKLEAISTPDQLKVEVIGHQWWWEVHYLRGEQRLLTTANEIHIPVGATVVFELLSRDVIHSFWVPNLHGKLDMIPGKRNRLAIRAQRAGVYRGQCAEFCGLQHAHMGMLVIAQEPGEFRDWMAAQQRPAPEPQTPDQLRGREVFLSSQCIVCHRIRGTIAGGSTGPDLTHLASRRTIAAATLPNRRGQLAGWIADPQSIKPGNRMPANQFPPDDFHALLSYLESLR
jgi:cytochrome c oxidase subunit II